MKTAESLPPSHLPSCAFTQHQTLVLNADYQPFGYPLEKLGAQDTVKGMFLERYRVVEWSNTYAHGPACEMRLPSVVALKEYIPQTSLYGTPTCNLENLYIRDHGTCQYTHLPLRMNSPNPDHAATMDHVVPQCRGGEGVWNNVLLASFSANSRKGNKRADEVGFNPRIQPWVPTGADLLHLWLTEERLTNLPVTWQEFLTAIKPSPRLQRLLESLAA